MEKIGGPNRIDVGESHGGAVNGMGGRTETTTAVATSSPGAEVVSTVAPPSFRRNVVSGVIKDLAVDLDGRGRDLGITGSRAAARRGAARAASAAAIARLGSPGPARRPPSGRAERVLGLLAGVPVVTADPDGGPDLIAARPARPVSAAPSSPCPPPHMIHPLPLPTATSATTAPRPRSGSARQAAGVPAAASLARLERVSRPGGLGSGAASGSSRSRPGSARLTRLDDGGAARPGDPVAGSSAMSGGDRGGGDPPPSVRPPSARLRPPSAGAAETSVSLGHTGAAASRRRPASGGGGGAAPPVRLPAWAAPPSLCLPLASAGMATTAAGSLQSRPSSARGAAAPGYHGSRTVSGVCSGGVEDDPFAPGSADAGAAARLFSAPPAPDAVALKHLSDASAPPPLAVLFRAFARPPPGDGASARSAAGRGPLDAGGGLGSGGAEWTAFGADPGAGGGPAGAACALGEGHGGPGGTLGSDAAALSAAAARLAPAGGGAAGSGTAGIVDPNLPPHRGGTRRYSGYAALDPSARFALPPGGLFVGPTASASSTEAVAAEMAARERTWARSRPPPAGRGGGDASSNDGGAAGVRLLAAAGLAAAAEARRRAGGSPHGGACRCPPLWPPPGAPPRAVARWRAVLRGLCWSPAPLLSVRGALVSAHPPDRPVLWHARSVAAHGHTLHPPHAPFLPAGHGRLSRLGARTMRGTRRCPLLRGIGARLSRALQWRGQGGVSS